MGLLTFGELFCCNCACRLWYKCGMRRKVWLIGSTVNPLKPPGLLFWVDSDADDEMSSDFCTGDIGDENSGTLHLSFGVEWLGKPFCICVDFFGVWISLRAFPSSRDLAIWIEEVSLIEALRFSFDVVKLSIMSTKLCKQWPKNRNKVFVSQQWSVPKWKQSRGLLTLWKPLLIHHGNWIKWWRACATNALRAGNNAFKRKAVLLRAQAASMVRKTLVVCKCQRFSDDFFLR